MIVGILVARAGHGLVGTNQISMQTALAFVQTEPASIASREPIHDPPRARFATNADITLTIQRMSRETILAHVDLDIFRSPIE